MTKDDYDDFHKVLEDIVASRKYLDGASRPWGRWFVLDVDQGFKVKKLEILPDQAISLQYHIHRTETWTIVQGEGKVIVDGNVFSVKKGDTFFVPRQSIHKITNTHLKEILIAIEVQIGEICREDDIVRC
jgi:mannose-6-phosphate isomerase-like protein (cupin superfamily)